MLKIDAQGRPHRCPPHHGLLTYFNTTHVRDMLGCDRFPEYCIGNPKASRITHDHVGGKFYFHD